MKLTPVVIKKNLSYLCISKTNEGIVTVRIGSINLEF
jgi:hypothetical protein